MNYSKLTGCFQVAVANVFVGLNVIFFKQLSNTLPAPFILELRYFFAALTLFIIGFFTKNKFKFYLSDQKFSINEKLIYFAMAISGGAVFNLIYLIGIRHTTAIAAGLISSTVPILIVFFSVIFLNQKLKLQHTLSAIFVAIGICFITIQTNTFPSQSINYPIYKNILANLIIFSAMIPEVLYTVLSKMISKKPVSSMTSALFINIINLIMCTPLFLWQMQSWSLFNLTSDQLILCFLIGLFSGVIFYSLYNFGIQKISAQLAGLFVAIVPVTSTICAVLILHEPFGTYSLVGLLLVVISIYMSVRINDQYSERVLS